MRDFKDLERIFFSIQFINIERRYPLRKEDVWGGIIVKTKPTLLLVEDEDQLRYVLESELKQAGFKVIQVESGEKAFDICLHEKVDCVVSDIHMPETSGFTLLKKLRLAGKTKIPVIFMTGYAAHDISELEGMGDIKVLSKPFEVRYLIVKIRESLEEIDLAS